MTNSDIGLRLGRALPGQAAVAVPIPTPKRLATFGN
jgi:hypothetical protein